MVRFLYFLETPWQSDQKFDDSVINFLDLFLWKYTIGLYLDLVKVPLGLPRSLNGCGQRGVIAQHQQPPFGGVVCLYHLGTHKLQQEAKHIL